METSPNRFCVMVDEGCGGVFGVASARSGAQHVIMAYDTTLADRVADHFTARDVPFEAKRMMGGLCFMVDGKMCVGVTKDRLMVRLDPADEGAALKQPGCVPMDFTGRPMKGFVFVHPEGWEEDEDLARWLTQALTFNPRAKASKKR